jgi:hypothetical protein
MFLSFTYCICAEGQKEVYSQIGHCLRNSVKRNLTHTTLGTEYKFNKWHNLLVNNLLVHHNNEQCKEAQHGTIHKMLA